MDILYIDYIDDLAEEMVGTFEDRRSNEDFMSVCAVCKYDDAQALISTLVSEYGYPLYAIDLQSPDVEEYDKEFTVSLFDVGIICTKSWHDDSEFDKPGYYHVIDDVVYLMEDCNSKIIDKIDFDEVYEVSYASDDDDSCSGDCDNCNLNHPVVKDSDRISIKVNGKEVTDSEERLARLTDLLNKSIAIQKEFDNAFRSW